MTLERLRQILEETGLPVAYRMWPQPMHLPYICYLETYSSNFAADGIVYAKVQHVNIELYTKTKDPGLEERLEAILKTAGIYWESNEYYLEDERCHEKIYEIEVIANG